ncbi:hypothetical protein PR048_032916 [Dryococelus australis]|uniref:Uncharacterized protein n=1 Tax=Dryococelus australis TaxID=614101 RepID=A0ABQ9G3L2_9NEOP|nr:hypothetical protein PR048_032916 [Dryococelus australis]
MQSRDCNLQPPTHDARSYARMSRAITLWKCRRRTQPVQLAVAGIIATPRMRHDEHLPQSVDMSITSLLAKSLDAAPFQTPRHFASLNIKTFHNFTKHSVNSRKRIHKFGAAVAERLARSPPTKANWAQSPAGSPDFRKWE